MDTTITEPSMTADEAAMLTFALERSRAQFAWKCGGLDDAGLRRRQPPSALTLAGLLKHLAYVEDEYVAVFLHGHRGGPLSGEPWTGVQPDTLWESALTDPAADLYALWSGAVTRSRTAWAPALAGGLDAASTYRLPSGEAPNLRRAYVDLHDEYARHVGHADLLREAVDGLVGEDPPQE